MALQEFTNPTKSRDEMDESAKQNVGYGYGEG